MPLIRCPNVSKNLNVSILFCGEQYAEVCYLQKTTWEETGFSNIGRGRGYLRIFKKFYGIKMPH